MGQYNISEKNCRILDNLLDITESIDFLYNKLYDLEFDGLKDSQEYKKHMEYLDIAVNDVEEKLYSDARMTIDSCMEIVQHISEHRVSLESKNDIETILSRQNYDRVCRRILNRLLDKPVLNVPYDMEKAIDNSRLSGVLDTAIKLIKTRIKIEKSIHDETLLLFISIIESGKKENKNLTIIPNLIKIKYDIAFTNRVIETKFMETFFSIAGQLSPNSKSIANSLGSSSYDYHSIKNFLGIHQAQFQIDKLLKINETELDDKNKFTSSILREASLRSNLLLIEDDNAIWDINEKFNTLIEKTQYLESSPQIIKSKDLIIGSFRKIRSDREIYKNLVLKSR